MKQRSLKSKVITGMLMLKVTAAVHAGIPLWSFTPGTGSASPHQTISSSTATVQYTVTNNSSKPHNLVMQPQAGISQAGPCVLAPKGTCTLILNITASALPSSGIKGGPVLCQANPNGTPNPNQCYQPSQANSLNIMLTSAPSTPSIDVSPTILTLTAGNTTPSCITVTNLSSSVAVQDLMAPVTPSSSEVTGNAPGTDCAASLGASSACSYCFLPGTQVETAQATFSGSNTSNSVPISITVGAASQANLTVTPSTLALSVTGVTTTTGNNSGMSRVFTIQNIGPDTATGIVCPTSASASIGPIVCNGCDPLANGGTCTVTITPTGTPSAAVADTNPTPITLTIQGSNTNPLNPTVNVLTYGSFYQAGYLFSIIETVNTSLGIGGTVVAESDNAVQNSTQYSLNGADTTPAMYSGTNGTTNTAAMVAQYGAGNYSATVCTTFSGGGYADWYLPAICQMGFGGSDAHFDCGASPGLIPNIQYNLLITNPSQSFNFINFGLYWSSAASENGAPDNAWYQQFAVGGGDGFQNSFNVVNTFGVRCVRGFQ